MIRTVIMNHSSRQRVCVVGLVFLLSFSPSARGQAPPFNDNFSRRILLSGNPIFINASNVGATREAGEPMHADKTGGASVWWTWTALINGQANLSTEGSSFDTLLAVYTGNTLASLVKYAWNDDAGDVSTSAVTFTAKAGQTFQIAVDGFEGETGQIFLRLSESELPQAPVWSLYDVNGALVRSSDYAGKVLIINFWATWSSPSRAQILDLIALQDKYRNDGLVVVGASQDTYDPAKMNAFIAQNGINYPILWSTKFVENRFGGISSIPTTILIDRQNHLARTWVDTQPRSVLEQEILPFLYKELKLQALMSAGAIQLRWPVTTANFIVESADNPAALQWQAINLSPVTLNGLKTLAPPFTNPRQFYRLHLQP